MQDLNKKLSGNWIDIRNNINDYQKLKDYFKLATADLKIQYERLKFAVEQGMLEYKQVVLSPLYRFFENIKYENPTMEEIEKQIRFVSGLLLVVLIQRLFCEGELKIPGTGEALTEDVFSKEDDWSIKEILQDLNRRLQAKPSLRVEPTVKNLLLQVARIKKEKETMHKLLPTIRQEAKVAYLNNFKQVFKEIEDKIKRYYLVLIQDELNPAAEDVNQPETFFQQMKKLGPILTQQCEKLAKLRTTLIYAKDEKYKIRELLYELTNEKKHFMPLLDKEADVYAYIDQSQVNEQSVNKMRMIVMNFLEKELAPV
jgi:hypothetical protein